MRIDHTLFRKRREAGLRRIGLVIQVCVTLGIALATLPAIGGSRGVQNTTKDKKGGKSAGFSLSQDATAEDVGLPLYPGAQRLKDAPDESSAVQLGLWGHSGGLKLVVLKLESGDSPAKIADFYRKALSKYGPVLDCTKSNTKPAKASNDKSNAIECDDDQPAEGGFELKAGTKDKQHIVGVELEKGRSKIALVYLENPNSGGN